ncbi:hypothetical protein HN011_006153 [Eciton burchellii]|nr:hypothetical protein HN011_006153 [Eciton burchellii]
MHDRRDRNLQKINEQPISFLGHLTLVYLLFTPSQNFPEKENGRNRITMAHSSFQRCSRVSCCSIVSSFIARDVSSFRDKQILLISIFATFRDSISWICLLSEEDRKRSGTSFFFSFGNVQEIGR